MPLRAQQLQNTRSAQQLVPALVVLLVVINQQTTLIGHKQLTGLVN